MSKVLETLRSRKFWITTVISIAAVLLFSFNQISMEKMLEIIQWATGVYVGGLSVEDGFKRLAPILKSMLEGDNG